MGAEAYNNVSYHDKSYHYTSDQEDLHIELRRLDELIRLLEIRVEELEKADRGISLSITVEKQNEEE